METVAELRMSKKNIGVPSEYLGRNMISIKSYLWVYFDTNLIVINTEDNKVSWRTTFLHPILNLVHISSVDHVWISDSSGLINDIDVKNYKKQILMELGSTSAILDFSFSSVNKNLIFGVGKNGYFFCFDIFTHKLVKKFQLSNSSLTVATSAPPSLLWIGSSDGTVFCLAESKAKTVDTDKKSKKSKEPEAPKLNILFRLIMRYNYRADSNFIISPKADSVSFIIPQPNISVLTSSSSSDAILETAIVVYASGWIVKYHAHYVPTSTSTGSTSAAQNKESDEGTSYSALYAISYQPKNDNDVPPISYRNSLRFTPARALAALTGSITGSTKGEEKKKKEGEGEKGDDEEAAQPELHSSSTTTDGDDVVQAPSLESGEVPPEDTNYDIKWNVPTTPMASSQDDAPSEEAFVGALLWRNWLLLLSRDKGIFVLQEKEPVVAVEKKRKDTGVGAAGGGLCDTPALWVAKFALEPAYVPLCMAVCRDKKSEKEKDKDNSYVQGQGLLWVGMDTGICFAFEDNETCRFLSLGPYEKKIGDIQVMVVPVVSAAAPINSFSFADTFSSFYLSEWPHVTFPTPRNAHLSLSSSSSDISLAPTPTYRYSEENEVEKEKEAQKQLILQRTVNELARLQKEIEDRDRAHAEELARVIAEHTQHTAEQAAESAKQAQSAQKAHDDELALVKEELGKLKAEKDKEAEDALKKQTELEAENSALLKKLQESLELRAQEAQKQADEAALLRKENAELSAENARLAAELKQALEEIERLKTELAKMQRDLEELKEEKKRNWVRLMVDIIEDKERFYTWCKMHGPVSLENSSSIPAYPDRKSVV